MTRLLLMTLSALALAGAARAQTFTVTGNFQYEDKGWGFNGWTGADPPRPIRRADVFVLNNATSAVLGSGSTDQNGDFSIQATSGGFVDVIVRADTDTDLDGNFQRMRVTNTSNQEYSAFSPVFPAHDTSTALDVGTTTALKILSGSQEANPFNMLDMGVDAWEYITGPQIGANAVGTSLKISWPNAAGSFATFSEAHMAADDGYDDAVILHELGHVLHNQYSDSDSPGGTHFFGDSDQDPRLSFGEGYATFLAGAVMDVQQGRQAIYMDASGSAQNGGVGLRMRLEDTSPYSGDAFGAADEVAVACTLYDITDSEDSNDTAPGSDDDLIVSTTLINGLNRHRAWWDVFVGPIDTASNVTLNDAWDGWFSEHGAGGLHAEMVALYGNRNIHVFLDPDEPNDTISTPMSATITGAWSGDRTLYTSFESPPAPGLSDKDWYALDLVKGSVIDIQTRYPGGANDADTQADTFIDVWDLTDAKVAEDDNGGTGRNAFVNDFLVTDTGTWKVRIRSNHAYRKYGRYNFRLAYQFENFLPEIDSGPVATPDTIFDDEASTLSVTASDDNPGQVLSYAWTPLAGGAITGSGSSVTFEPPTVLQSTDFDVQLVVSDDLGAEADPVIVTVTVEPEGDVCGNAASALVGGVAKPGVQGDPIMTVNNLPTIPNTDFELQVTNVIPNAQAFLIFGLSLISAPFDQGTMYPAPDFIKPRMTKPTGDLIIKLPTSDPSFCGITVYWQLMIIDDPGAAGFRQTAQTPYAETTFGS